MVAPISGPVTRAVSANKMYAGQSLEDFSSYQLIYRQKPPYTLPLPYTSKISTCKGRGLYAGYAPDTYPASLAVHDSWAPSSEFNQLKMVAYDRLKDGVGNSASLGASLAEFGQSVQMIAARVEQLLRFTRALKKGRLVEAANSLGVSPKVRPKKTRSKDLASTWLEYSFGWSPLIGDIYNALEVLGSEIPDKPVEATASTRDIEWKLVPSGPWAAGYSRKFEKIAVKYGTKVRVTNPNLYLWNQLGLVNPATVVWEVIPFSFVVDWFVNVEQFLGMGTDFLGLSMSDTYTTLHAKGTHYQYWGSGFPGRTSTFAWATTHRALGIDKPSLALRAWKVPSWKRAANAVSLLALNLKSF